MKKLMSTTMMTALVSAAATTNAIDSTQSVVIAETKLFGVYEENENAKAGNRNIKVGAFDVEADATGTVTFDDNIFATENNEESDTIVTIRPTVKVKSAWSRHSADASAFINDRRYLSNSSEDNTEFGGAVNGRLDIKRGTFVTGNLMAERRFEDRGNPDSATAADEPTQYARNGGELRIVHAPGRVSLSAGVKLENRTYEDGETTAGANINNGDRDRLKTTSSVRAGYEVKPGLEAYTQFSYVDTSYDEVDVGVGGERSSDGYDAIVGLSADITGKLQGDAYVGITEREYDAATLSDIDEAIVGANILYRPNGLTSVKIGLKRSIEETTEANAAGYVQTALTGRVEHAIRRNILVGANLTVAQNEYEGGSSDREDDLIVLGLDGRYDLGNNLTASVGYEVTDRDSSQAGADYTRGQFMTRLMGQF